MGRRGFFVFPLSGPPGVTSRKKDWQTMLIDLVLLAIVVILGVLVLPT